MLGDFMLSFKSFGLPSELVQVLERLSITTPTPIQKEAIPAALEGADLLATAQTGSGKTMAYLLPTLTKMRHNAHEQALILAPTRELAEQIKNALVSLLGRKGQHDVALLIGGASLFKQFIALKKSPRFIIGTPGRIIDHLERGKLTLKGVRFLILDEVDRMLDMGFSEALEVILKDVPKERQTLMFSATLPPNIAKLSKKYLNNPTHITIGSTTQVALQIKQAVVKTTAGERFNHLLKELESREGSVIIFVKTKASADVLAEKLQAKEHRAEAIHGDLRQRRRDAVIRAFRKGLNRIMVATDIAARGLDIPHIKHVINYDLPQCAEDYIHRIGRTGRAGLEGNALSYVLPSEGGKWKAIHRLLNSDPSTAYVGDNQGGSDWKEKRSSNRGNSRGNKDRRKDGGKMGYGKKRENYGKSPAGQGQGKKRAKPRDEYKDRAEKGGRADSGRADSGRAGSGRADSGRADRRVTTSTSRPPKRNRRASAGKERA